MESIRVMVVDDEVHFADNIARLLSNRGFYAQAVYDGPAAVRLMEDTYFDAVVLDLRMPMMDGIKTLRELKKKNSDIEVMMLTGQADVETGIEAIREGAFDYLFKPCDIDTLTEKIREAVTAEQIKHHPVMWPRRLVKEISSSNFIRLETGDHLQRALDIFNTIHRTGMRDELHVIDTKDRLKGVVSKKDLIQAAQRIHPGRSIQWQDIVTHPALLPEIQIGDMMHPAPPSYLHSRPDEPLDELAERMIQHNVRCLPVMDNERFVGIIRFKDVIQHVSRQHAVDP